MACMAASSVSSIPWPLSHLSTPWRILKNLYLPMLANSAKAPERLACSGCPQSTIVQWRTSRLDGKECWGKTELDWSSVKLFNLFNFCLTFEHCIQPLCLSLVIFEGEMDFMSLLLLQCGRGSNCAKARKLWLITPWIKHYCMSTFLEFPKLFTKHMFHL